MFAACRKVRSVVWNSSTGSEEPPSVRRMKWRVVLGVDAIIIPTAIVMYLVRSLGSWSLLLLSASGLLVIALFVMLYVWEKGVRKRVAAGEECANCRYNLHGLPDTVTRCPECGWRR